MLVRTAAGVFATCLVSPALAQVQSLDRVLIGLHYYQDYQAPGEETVNVTSQGNGLSLLQFDQTFSVAHGGQSRHVGELANNPSLPYHAPPSESWDFSATVRISASSTAATEGGLHVGHLGTNWPPATPTRRRASSRFCRTTAGRSRCSAPGCRSGATT
jgi:hypothetical protein